MNTSNRKRKMEEGATRKKTESNASNDGQNTEESAASSSANEVSTNSSNIGPNVRVGAISNCVNPAQNNAVENEQEMEEGPPGANNPNQNQNPIPQPDHVYIPEIVAVNAGVIDLDGEDEQPIHEAVHHINQMMNLDEFQAHLFQLIDEENEIAGHHFDPDFQIVHGDEPGENGWIQIVFVWDLAFEE